MTTTTAQSPSWRSPDSLILAALCLFAFSVVFSVTVVQIALFLAIIALLAKKHRERTLRDILSSLASHPLFVPWMVYLGVCLLTALTAYYPAKGLGQLNSDFLKFTCLFVLFLSLKKAHLPAASLLYILAAVMAATAGVTEVAIAAFKGHESILRANAFMNAVRFGEIMAIALILISSRILIPTAEKFRHENLFLKLSAPVVFFALILSQTRGAYLGLLIALGVMFILEARTRKKLLVLGAAMLLLGFFATFFVPSVKHRLSAMINTDRTDYAPDSPSTGINIRMGLWKVGFKMLSSHPVLGVGPDNVKKVFKKFQPDQIGNFEVWGSLHNLYVHQAAERGLLGLGALLFLFWAMFRYCLNRLRQSSSPYALWAVCSLSAFYVMNLTEISFQHVHTSFAIFMAIAFAAAAEKEAV